MPGNMTISSYNSRIPKILASSEAQKQAERTFRFLFGARIILQQPEQFAHNSRASADE